MLSRQSYGGFYKKPENHFGFICHFDIFKNHKSLIINKIEKCKILKSYTFHKLLIFRTM